MADYVSEIWMYTLLIRWFGCATLMCEVYGSDKDYVNENLHECADVCCCVSV